MQRTKWYIAVRVLEFLSFAGCGVCIAKGYVVGICFTLALGLLLWGERARLERDKDAK